MGAGAGSGGYNNLVKTIKQGIDLGMNFIDTAEAYDNGLSESLIGKVIGNIREKVIIATKVSPENLAADKLENSLNNSLKRLNTDFVDLYQVHWTNPKVPFEETAKALLLAVKSGKVKNIGVCNYTLKEISDFNAILGSNKIVSLQVEYNLRERYIEKDILSECRRNKTTIIAYSPLLHGKLSENNEKVLRLKTIAEKYNKTIAQIALNWVVHGDLVVAIPKTTSEKHLKENSEAADFKMDDKDYSFINGVFEQKIVKIPTEKISVSSDGIDNRKVYKTIHEALENKLGFVPSPVDLARDIKNGNVLKPPKVIINTKKDSIFEYELIEGRIRYWAWVIAFEGKKPIPAVINEDF